MINTNQWVHDKVTYYRGYTLIEDRGILIYDMHMEKIDTAGSLMVAQRIIDDWHRAR